MGRSPGPVSYTHLDVYKRQGYLARQTVKHLVDAKMIETKKAALVNERVASAMVEELALEDRINDEVRVILEAFQDDMRKTCLLYTSRCV